MRDMTSGAAANRVTLYGVVRKVTYEGNRGFRVLSVDSGFPEPKACVGTMPGIAVEDSIWVRGAWELWQGRDSSDLQVRVFEVARVDPVTTDAVADYLGRHLGDLGRVYGALIALQHGKNTCALLDEAPLISLADVRGFPAEARGEFARSWREHRARNAIRESGRYSCGCNECHCNASMDVVGSCDVCELMCRSGDKQDIGAR